jgi:hypothetical protein
MYHFPFRSYSPELGRWMQRDPLGYVQGMNLYAYAASMAVGLTDPLGLLSLAPPWPPGWHPPMLPPDEGGGDDGEMGPPLPPAVGPCGGMGPLGGHPGPLPGGGGDGGSSGSEDAGDGGGGEDQTTHPAPPVTPAPLPLPPTPPRQSGDSSLRSGKNEPGEEKNANREQDQRQVATRQQIIAELNRLQAAHPEMTAAQLMAALKEKYLTDGEMPRYIQMEDGKWIDMQHFSAAAELAHYVGPINAIIGGWLVEVRQWAGGHASGKPFGGNEDLGSNYAGATFWDAYGGSTGSLGNRVANHLERSHGRISDNPDTFPGNSDGSSRYIQPSAALPCP